MRESLFRQLDSINLTVNIVLVLNDFYLISNAELLRSFEYFLSNTPPCVHLVLLTREKPEIYVAGYELQGELLRIDEQDLLLTDEEGIEFLKNTLSLSLSDETLLELVDKATGWIGSLQLLAAMQTAEAAPKVPRTGKQPLSLRLYYSRDIQQADTKRAGSFGADIRSSLFQQNRGGISIAGYIL